MRARVNLLDALLLDGWFHRYIPASLIFPQIMMRAVDKDVIKLAKSVTS